MSDRPRLLWLLILALTSACQGTGHSTTTSSARGDASARSAGAERRRPRPEVAEEGSGFHAREGATVRVGTHTWGLGGDYDGETIIVGPDGDFVIVPEYDATTGPEVGLGYRGKRYGFELTYKRWESEGDFLGFVEDDEWNYLDLDFKEYFLLSSRLQPYLTLGMGYFFGTIVEGATDGASLADADFSGVSVQGGVGLAFYLSDRLSLDGRAIYRYAETLDVENFDGDTVSIEDGLSANAWGVSVGLSYTF